MTIISSKHFLSYTKTDTGSCNACKEESCENICCLSNPFLLFSDIVEQYSEPMISSTTPRNSCEPVMSGYFSSPQPQCLRVQSPNVRNIILQRKTPELKKERRSLNPFLKSNAGSTSPDLSDGTLKSGLSKILKEGITQKKVVQRVLSP